MLLRTSLMVAGILAALVIVGGVAGWILLAVVALIYGLTLPKGKPKHIAR